MLNLNCCDDLNREFVTSLPATKWLRGLVWVLDFSHYQLASNLSCPSNLSFWGATFWKLQIMVRAKVIKVRNWQDVLFFHCTAESERRVRARRPAGHGGAGHFRQVVLAPGLPMHGQRGRHDLLRPRRVARGCPRNGLRPEGSMLHQSEVRHSHGGGDVHCIAILSIIKVPLTEEPQSNATIFNRLWRWLGCQARHMSCQILQMPSTDQPSNPPPSVTLDYNARRVIKFINASRLYSCVSNWHVQG